MERQNRNEPADANSRVYEPPQIEEVLSAEDLAREVHYAGIVPADPSLNPG